MRLGRMRLIGLLLAVILGAVVVMLVDGVDDQPGEPVAARGEVTSTTTTTTTTPPSTRKAPPTTGCAKVIKSLSPRERLAQLLMVGVDPSSADSATKVAGKQGAGGIFLGGNDTTLLTDHRLDAVRDAAPVPLAVSVDEEGGRVQRVDGLDGDVPSARQMTKSMSVAQVHKLARQRGKALHDRGVTVDFAPVVDVTSQPDDDVIGDRSFSADAATVARYAGAFAQGLQESGVMPVVKHFPGHGHASGDSHTSAVRTPPLAQLRKVDLVPYEKLLRTTRAAVMVGHMAVPGLTQGLPASLSPATYRLLRDDYGFRGLVMTDDLGGMQAVSGRYPLPKAVVTSLAAGADMALWSSGEQYLDDVLDALQKALADGTLTQAGVTDSLTRVLTAKGACGA
jgi:beta-N-acetylhexosaminidase